MAALSNYLENKLLDHALATTAYTKPTTVYVALFTTDPTDAGTGTEVSGGAYVRKAVTFGAATGGSASNSADVTFDVATASWGTVTHLAIFDAATAGNMLFHGAFTQSKAIASNDQFKIPAGNLTITLN
jgi:hypothetical protein